MIESVAPSNEIAAPCRIGRPVLAEEVRRLSLAISGSQAASKSNSVLYSLPFSPCVSMNVSGNVRGLFVNGSVGSLILY